MRCTHEPPTITLTFGQAHCRSLVHNLNLLSHRIKQVEGVQSVVTRLDLHGCQRVVIYTQTGVENSDLLRRMAAVLREPVEVTRTEVGTSVASDRMQGNVQDKSACPRYGLTTTQTDPVPDVEEMREHRSIAARLRQFVYGSLAVASLGMAWVGLLVPGIPTVPFVILAAALAAKSSPALLHRLQGSRVFGPIIRDWDTHRAVRRQIRIQLAVATAAIVTITILVASPSPALYTLIGIMAVFSAVVIWLIPVIPDDEVIREDEPGIAARQTILFTAVG